MGGAGGGRAWRRGGGCVSFVASLGHLTIGRLSLSGKGGKGERVGGKYFVLKMACSRSAHGACAVRVSTGSFVRPVFAWAAEEETYVSFNSSTFV